MSNEITFERVFRKGAAETRNISINFTKLLDENETISSVTVAEVTTTALTLSASANTQGTRIDGKSVAPGKAITIIASGGTAGTTYSILITLNTSGSQVIKRYLLLEIIAQG